LKVSKLLRKSLTLSHESANKRDGADRKSYTVCVKFPDSQSVVACSSSRDVGHRKNKGEMSCYSLGQNISP
jgi:hypothetical protein